MSYLCEACGAAVSEEAARSTKARLDSPSSADRLAMIRLGIPARGEDGENVGAVWCPACLTGAAEAELLKLIDAPSHLERAIADELGELPPGARVVRVGEGAADYENVVGEVQRQEGALVLVRWRWGDGLARLGVSGGYYRRADLEPAR